MFFNLYGVLKAQEHPDTSATVEPVPVFVKLSGNVLRSLKFKNMVSIAATFFSVVSKNSVVRVIVDQLVMNIK